MHVSHHLWLHLLTAFYFVLIYHSIDIDIDIDGTIASLFFIFSTKHRRACELHLECGIDDLDSNSQSYIDHFLASNENELSSPPASELNNDNHGTEEKRDFEMCPRLFIWISKATATVSTSTRQVFASTETYDSGNYGAIAFINTSNQPITTHSQIQCITLTPLQTTFDSNANGNGTDGTTNDDNNNNNSTSNESSVNTFHLLQLYTQHAFVPTLKSLPTTNNESKTLQSLEGKIRELDMTLSQCRRSTLSSIPHITLTTHAIIESKSNHLPSNGKMDLESIGLSSHVSDDEFLNQVQSIVNSWIPSIQKVTMLPSTQPLPDSDWEEVTYWHNLSQALHHIQTELTKPSTLLTLHLLKSAKRFVSTLALENNTHLKSAEEYVNDVTAFLKHYPAETLSSCMTWSALHDTLEEIFCNCVARVRSSRYYSLNRLVKLIEASLSTAKARMEFILRDEYKLNGVLWIDYDEYERNVHGPSSDLFVQMDLWIAKFKEFVLDLGRKRKISNISQILNGMNQQQLMLKERLDALQNFRSGHEKLRSVVSEVLMGEEDISGGEKGLASSALKDVEEAPITAMTKIDVLDLSDGGKVAFETALEKYERMIDSIEERLAKLLRDKLTACQVSFDCM